MEVKISEMKISDLNSISSNLYTEFDDFWTYNVFKQELENSNSKYLVAKINNEIVGFAGFIKIIDEADISNIVVKKKFRNLKIGSTLLKKIIELASSLNLKQINLEVNESNIPAIKLYTRFGFKTCGLRKKYYNNTENAILMQYELNKHTNNH